VATRLPKVVRSLEEARSLEQGPDVIDIGCREIRGAWIPPNQSVENP